MFRRHAVPLSGRHRCGAWRARGIPVYGIYPYPISNDDLSRMHGNDERVSIESLRQGTELIYQNPSGRGREVERAASPFCCIVIPITEGVAASHHWRFCLKAISPRFTLVTALLLASGACLWASPAGSVSGTVKDPSGALIPGVKLTLVSLATNAQLTTVTNSGGEFQFLQLAPATYKLAAESSGFKKAAVASVLVQVDQVTHVELSMEVGSVNESVQVEAVAPLLENDKSTISSVVDTRTIGAMPLNARQFLDLALLTPGAVPSQPGQQGGGFNVSGARSQSNNFLLDGVSNMDTQIGSALGNFRITDAVQEFAVQTSVPTAEFGRGHGAQVSIVTKSGTNQFHGSAFEYLRNSKMDAADFFTNKLGGAKSTLHRNQYGATFGGPIRKDKTFFFLSWEGFRQVNPTVSTTRVPTDAERATVTDPISRAVLKSWPSPNAPGTTTNFIANVPAATFDNTGVVKIDHHFGEKDVLTGRWGEFQGTAVTAGALPLLGGTSNMPVSRSGVVTETHTFSPSMLNEFRFGFSRNQTYLTVQDSGFNAASIFLDASGKPLAGVVDGTKNVLDSGIPTITVAGGFAVLGTASNYPQGRITNTYELFDNMSWVAPFGASKHSFRWGFHIRREEARRFLDGSARGAFNFQNFADFAVGQVNTSSFFTGSSMCYWKRYPFDLYWQDSYKIKTNLTLNYGVRYEYPSAIYQTRLQATNFIPGVGAGAAGHQPGSQYRPDQKGTGLAVLYAGALHVKQQRRTVGQEQHRTGGRAGLHSAVRAKTVRQRRHRDSRRVPGGLRRRVQQHPRQHGAECAV